MVTDKTFIKQQALIKEEENDAFRHYLQKINTDTLDILVHEINNDITPKIDCTQCGACCKQLMINVTAKEKLDVAAHLNISANDFNEKYIEESTQGKMVMNTIPCHFLLESKCSIYENRFTECRAFPHLHEYNFKGRLFGTLIHYAMCPIIYNVVEQLKVDTNFITA